MLVRVLHQEPPLGKEQRVNVSIITVEPKEQTILVEVTRINKGLGKAGKDE